MGQSWSGSNTFAWTPPAAGTYTIQAWVRNAGSVTAWDTWGSVGPLTVIPSGVVPFSKIAPTNGTTWLSNIPDSDLADEQRGRELR
jgi:hypothetical protein